MATVSARSCNFRARRDLGGGADDVCAVNDPDQPETPPRRTLTRIVAVEARQGRRTVIGFDLAFTPMKGFASPATKSLDAGRGSRSTTG